MSNLWESPGSKLPAEAVSEISCDPIHILRSMRSARTTRHCLMSRTEAGKSRARHEVALLAGFGREGDGAPAGGKWDWGMAERLFMQLL